MPDLLELMRSKLSHDLRSRINVVLGYCDLVSEEISELGAANAAEDLATIRRACEDLLLTNDEVRFILNESKEPLPEGEIPLDAMARKIDEDVRRLAGASPLTFSKGQDATTAGLERAIRSIVHKAALSFPDGCNALLANAGRLAIELAPAVGSAVGASTLEGFVSRYASGADPDPKNDFDLFYVLQVAEVEGAAVDAALTESGDAARIVITWS
ncbi:MAG: hypothetical protein U5O39_16500 [Gammaproteobacteria bacterium]|nr:hypothetical protein [Gammaproteobacteria bacterium]